MMNPKVVKTKDYIEFFGHYDDIAKCAKLSALASLYAIDSKVGYAKFPIEYEEDINKALGCDNIFADSYVGYMNLKCNTNGVSPVIQIGIAECDYVVINGNTYYNDKEDYVEGFALQLTQYLTDDGRYYLMAYPFDDSVVLTNGNRDNRNVPLEFYIHYSGNCDFTIYNHTNGSTVSNNNLTGYGNKLSFNTTYNTFGDYYFKINFTSYNGSTSGDGQFIVHFVKDVASVDIVLDNNTLLGVDTIKIKDAADETEYKDFIYGNTPSSTTSIKIGDVTLNGVDTISVTGTDSTQKTFGYKPE